MKKSKLENAIVTGGAGFIGSHLVDYLLKEDYKVTVIDNFSSGRIDNLVQHKKNKNLRIVNADVADFKNIKKYFNKIDYVFHLAALADIVPSIKNPLSYHHSNVEGTISVLEASRINNVKRFVYAASSSCYGIPDKYPTPDSITKSASSFAPLFKTDKTKSGFVISTPAGSLISDAFTSPAVVTFNDALTGLSPSYATLTFLRLRQNSTTSSFIPERLEN